MDNWQEESKLKKKYSEKRQIGYMFLTIVGILFVLLLIMVILWFILHDKSRNLEDYEPLQIYVEDVNTPDEQIINDNFSKEISSFSSGWELEDDSIYESYSLGNNLDNYKDNFTTYFIGLSSFKKANNYYEEYFITTYNNKKTP